MLESIRIGSLMKIILLFCACLILAGCANLKGITSNQQDVKELTPPTPQSLVLRDFDWKLLKDNNSFYVGMKYEDYILFLEDKESIIKYIQESNIALCYYIVKTNPQSTFCTD